MARIIGVDVGTGNIVCAEYENGTLEFYKAKDAFFKVNPAEFMQGSAMHFGEKMLKKSGANFIKIEGILHILGDEAFKFANLFHKECLRPMARGVLNPNETVSYLMVKELIRGIAGESTDPEDIVYFCVPASPIDNDFDIEYHSQMLRKIFEELGFKNINMMTEGLAVIYSELEEDGFTGIGVSMGAGMVNISYAFMGVPVFNFSLTKSGDWVDENAAKAVSETKSAVQFVKERGINLHSPKDNVEQAIIVYYNALIDYIIKQFNVLYEQTDKKKLPNITSPIKVVVSGGTSMVEGFTEVLAEKIRDHFPIPVSEVIHADQPLYAVARGLYNAAKLTMED